MVLTVNVTYKISRLYCTVMLSPSSQACFMVHRKNARTSYSFNTGRFNLNHLFTCPERDKSMGHSEIPQFKLRSPGALFFPLPSTGDISSFCYLLFMPFPFPLIWTFKTLIFSKNSSFLQFNIYLLNKIYTQHIVLSIKVENFPLIYFLFKVVFHLYSRR